MRIAQRCCNPEVVQVIQPADFLIGFQFSKPGIIVQAIVGEIHERVIVNFPILVAVNIPENAVLFTGQIVCAMNNVAVIQFEDKVGYGGVCKMKFKLTGVRRQVKPKVEIIVRIG